MSCRPCAEAWGRCGSERRILATVGMGVSVPSGPFLIDRSCDAHEAFEVRPVAGHRQQRVDGGARRHRSAFIPKEGQHAPHIDRRELIVQHVAQLTTDEAPIARGIRCKAYGHRRYCDRRSSC